MPKGPEFSSPEQQRQNDTGAILRKARGLGIGPMDEQTVQKQFASIRQQLENGIQGQSEPRLMAIKTGIRLVPTEAWRQVPTGERVLVGEFGGTNFNVALAEKQKNGTIAIGEPLHSQAIPREERQVTFDQLTDRVAQPIAEHAHLVGEGPLKFGLSVGLPHENVSTNYGIDVDLKAEKGGVLPKENVILDWDTIPVEERALVAAVGKRVLELSPRIQVKTHLGINDTPGVALDAGSAEKAQRAGFRVAEDGSVNGTGTNKALYHQEAGLINTEIGHAAWKDNPVSKRMRARLMEKGLLTQEQDHPELEHETGQYLPLRLAAGIELLGEQGEIGINYPHLLAERVETLSELEPALMSKLVTGEMTLTGYGTVNETIQQLAQCVMERAAQVYGIMHATTLEDPQSHRETPLAALTEGSTILKGKVDAERTLKGVTETVAAQLGRPVVLWEAKGMAGIAGLTMAHEHIPQR